MNEVQNNTETTKLVGGITGKGFMPGQSGNPGGRPKGTLKEFVQKMFLEMDDKEKKEWLKKNRVKGINIWQMAEGKPEQGVDAKVDVVSRIISADE